MSTFKKKDWVCLVTPEELQAQRALQDAQNKGSWMEGSLMRAPLWRQISITATPELLTFDLGNVNEGVAHGGCWDGSYAARTVRLTWDDLNDLDGLSRIFEHEQLCVFRKLSEMVAVLRENMTSLRTILAA